MNLKYRYVTIIKDNTHVQDISSKVAQCLKYPLLDMKTIANDLTPYFSIRGQELADSLILTCILDMCNTLLITSEDNLVISLPRDFGIVNQQSWIGFRQQSISVQNVIFQFIEVNYQELAEKAEIIKRNNLKTAYSASIWDENSWDARQSISITDGNNPFTYNFRLGGTVETEVNFLYEWIKEHTPALGIQ